MIFSFQGIAPFEVLKANQANILAFVGHKIGGGFWENVMIVAVLGGTLASLQAAVVSSGRISFAMGRDRVFPKFFDSVHPRWRTPWNATILLGLLNIVFLWGTTLFSSIGTALTNIVSTLGLMAAIFYFLTAFTAIWYYRKVITKSAGNLILGGIFPGIGAAFMAFVVIYSLATGDPHVHQHRLRVRTCDPRPRAVVRLQGRRPREVLLRPEYELRRPGGCGARRARTAE